MMDPLYVATGNNCHYQSGWGGGAGESPHPPEKKRTKKKNTFSVLSVHSASELGHY